MTVETPGVSWEEAIAAKAQRDISQVRDFLSRYRIRPSPILPSPKNLLIRKLRFTGVKEGIPGREPEPFDFIWDDLGPGLWVLGGPANLAGKSSILETMKWLLRGQFPSTMRDDVRTWIRSAELQFDIDAERFRVRLTNSCGSVAGVLARYVENGSETSLATFADESEFTAVMSNFMFAHLSLDRILSWQKGQPGDDGSIVENGWPALSSALSIGVKYEALLGDTAQQGLSIRLLNMYIGLPWVTTLSECVAARGAVKAHLERGAKILRDEAGRRDQRVAALQSDLDKVRVQLGLTEGNEAFIAASQRITDELAKIFRSSSLLLADEAAAVAELATANQALIEDRRELRDFLENRDAGLVFGKLEPVCCPKCESELGHERAVRESKGGGCRVCGEVSPATVVSEDHERQLKARQEASERAVKMAGNRHSDITGRLADASAQRKALETEMTGWAAKREASGLRDALLLDEQRLLARMEEAKVGSSDAAVHQAADIDAVIVEACEVETRKRSIGVQKEVLTEVAAQILVLARKFGMNALTSAELKGNASLLLVTGGSPTSYSKVTEGEKLRLKVATAIAIMSVGQRRGVGRHPGLLLVDSPAAQEVSEEDLNALMAGLADIAAEVPGLQVIMATKHMEAALMHVGPNHSRLARSDGRMW